MENEEDIGEVYRAGMWISALKQGLEGVWSLPQWDWEMPDLAGNFLADLDGKSQRTNVVREQGRTSE